MKRYQAIFTGVPLLLLVIAWAVSAAPAGGPQPLRMAQAVKPQGDAAKRMLANKLKLLDQLVNRSPAVKRIENSTNAEAKQLLENARQAYQHAQRELEADHLDAAGLHINEGLRAVGIASRKVGDSRRRNEAAKARYQELRQRVLTFLEAFQRVASEKKDRNVTALLGQSDVDALLMEADRLAKKDAFEAANQQLTQLADNVEVALIKARYRETLLHELKFDTPEDEYAYEMGRNRSYVMLVKLLTKERPMSVAGSAYVEKSIQRNETLRKDAESLAANGDTAAAIKKLEAGTKQLGRALRASGMAFP